MQHVIADAWLKCAHSPLNLRIFSTIDPIYTHDGASAKFSTNSHETNGLWCSFIGTEIRATESVFLLTSE